MCARYHAVYFEISGYCNARCAYCHSGVQRPDKAKFVDLEVFQNTLIRLLADGVLRKDTVISLYNWGEPTLHPKLSELVDIVNTLGLRFALSTNASRVMAINQDFVRNLDQIIFSMPGFSQNAYDRIHGFKFSEIIANIDRIVSECRRNGFKGRFAISYHVYRFNVGELKACEQFADRRRIMFKPYFAILNHWWEINDYIQGKLPLDRKIAAERDLFTLEGMDQILATAPKIGYQCPQNNYLNIDENGRVVTCCQIARDHPDYSCGSALIGDLGATLKKKQRQPVCGSCISSGLAYYFNTSLQRPSFYQPSNRQQVMRLTQNMRDLTFAKLGRFARKALVRVGQSLTAVRRGPDS